MQLICTRCVSIKNGNGAILLSSIRVLLADDFKDWRRHVRSLFKTRPEWQVVAEAADGLEAIQKAEELKPDLIVLDIGLPKLNGIDAARRIRKLSPSSKIVFLSQDNDPEVVQAALGTGAQGYVYKTDVRSDLLPAIKAALRDSQFVSRSLKGHEFAETSEEEVPHRHEVLFYSDDTVFLDTFARFIAVALKAGDAAIVLATKSHRDSLLLRLKAEGMDTDGAVQQGTYVPLDAADVLSNVMVDGLLDPVRYFGGLGGLIESAVKAARSEQPRVVVCGEGVALLHAAGAADAAIRIEQVCNDLSKTYEIDVLCAYPLNGFHGEENEHDFQSICAEHSAVHSQ